MNFFQDKKHLFFFENQTEFKLIYKEVFKKESYEVPKSILLEIQKEIKNPLIIDIGAHIGLATIYFKDQFPNSQIIAYEPNPNIIKILQENININGLENVSVVPKAISNKTGKIDFYIDNVNLWNSNSSMLQSGWNNNIKLKKIEVDAIDFCTVLKQNPNIIKIDIEGAEFSLIKNNFETIKKTVSLRFMSIEFHQNPQNKNKKLNEFLKLLTLANLKYKVFNDDIDNNLYLIHCYR